MCRGTIYCFTATKHIFSCKDCGKNLCRSFLKKKKLLCLEPELLSSVYGKHANLTTLKPFFSSSSNNSFCEKSEKCRGASYEWKSLFIRLFLFGLL
ncbi:MAG: hypothetical protein DRO07_01800 [Candidatus Iainarchaeum archaeon]|uniref:Uncharacterized protein n=1 Tax=Candidatus Iainarchaeum sp. TaxID=3101447 RepID=A0A497JFN1_9ARCH|nr:MAG: hypothetical protein DRO07_01800 [Candidatus Diapherotrites archaeon]